ncbi:MAG: Arylsulfatase [Planctomycetes bacterium ADurb.Bin126]|nr:MAG: Arylsulfatase [Planctomycetes bacterium ADurb.Bin126]HQL76025.1 sulfatase [Phycisphaerae bacterium]
MIRSHSQTDSRIAHTLRLLGRAMCGACLLAASVLPAGRLAGADRSPNFVIVYVDDLGYGDLGPFGSKTHRTPAIDRMAEQGMRLTDFYSTCSVCTPSRSSVMTGCYPRRVNMHVDEKNRCVLFTASRKGLHPDEVTIADLLKTKGYATACIGKWHLGDHPKFMPTSQGFDEYFGIPYSNDMHTRQVPLPLVRNLTVIEAPLRQDTVTERYTKEAIRFIKANKDRPFFLYLPHTAVHLPLHPGAAFKGKSKDGAYGDWVEEVDWSMDELFQTLQAEGIDQNTLVVLTSDNGSQKAGSNLPLRGGKGRTDEGGMRMPCIIRYPGKIPAGSSSSEITATIDLLPTFARLAGAVLPERVIDGRDIWPILSRQNGAKSPHEAFYYYQMDQLQAVRSGPWKLFVPMEAKKRNWGKPEGKTELKLFNLAQDIHEDNNVADAHPEVVARLLALAEKARQELGDGDRPGKGQRPAGWVDQPSPRLLEGKD